MGTGPTRWYAASIAVVSGLYSVGSAVGLWGEPVTGMDGMAGMGVAGWVMLAVGVVVLAHGVVLLTPAAERLGRLSGPLMVVWAVVMLANQLVGAMGDAMASRMGIDAGMVAVAILMLVSGIIMIARPMGGRDSG